MIVDPDMPDHWKVQMLAGMLGDDAAAPVYLIRLWGHCQNRKSHVFDSLPPMGIRAICKYPGDPDQLDAALIECGFIARKNESAEVFSKGLAKIKFVDKRRLDISEHSWKKIRQLVFSRDGMKCQYCGSTEKLECDHFMPLTLGGRSTMDNLVTSCKLCNRAKSNKHPEVWLSETKGVRHEA